MQKIVPWPSVNISRIANKPHFVIPGVTFQTKERDDSIVSIEANFSGTRKYAK